MKCLYIFKWEDTWKICSLCFSFNCVCCCYVTSFYFTLPTSLLCYLSLAAVYFDGADGDGGFGVFLSQWYYMSSVVHCQFICACFWFYFTISFRRRFMYVCGNSLIRVITKIHIHTLQQSVKEWNDTNEESKREKIELRKKSHEMWNDNSSSVVNSSIDEKFVCIHRQHKKHHKNTRKPIKKLISFEQFASHWQPVWPALSDWRFCSQHTIYAHIVRSRFSWSQGRFNRRPQSISLYFRTNFRW